MCPLVWLIDLALIVITVRMGWLDADRGVASSMSSAICTSTTIATYHGPPWQSDLTP